MNKKSLIVYKQQLDGIAQIIPGEDGEDVEYWYARDLQKVLGYAKWSNFVTAIERAQISCKSQNLNTFDHFRKVGKMVQIGSGAKREVDDYMLTRYACYLIAQNGDPGKEEIAFAQSYFAIQTRKVELIEEHMQDMSRLSAREKLRTSERRLSQNIYERGVDDQGFARIRSRGDTALFGGRTTQAMKRRLGVKTSRSLADFLPTLTIAAKNLATEMTNFKVEQNDLYGEPNITEEHVNNNISVRNMLGQRGIKPEDLPPAEDITKLERRTKTANRKISQSPKSLPKSV